MKVLFLFETPLPDFTTHPALPEELLVMAALPQVTAIHALSPAALISGSTSLPTQLQIPFKLHQHRFSWPVGAIFYYLTWLGLLFFGRRLCRRYHFDLIQAESPHLSGLAALLLTRRYRLPFITEYRVNYPALLNFRYGPIIGGWLTLVFHTFSLFVFSRSALVAANSATLASWLKHRHPHLRVAYYHPGIKPPPITPLVSSRRNLDFLGRLHPDKGPDLFLQLISLHQTWFRAHRCHFRLAGIGPLYPQLIQYCQVHQLTDLVTFVGYVDRWTFLSQTYLLINTTLVSPALEMALIEAAALGIPSVAFGSKSMPETVISGQTGFLVPVYNLDRLFAHCRQLLTDPQLYLRFSEAAKIHAQDYTFAGQVKKLQAIYKVVYA
ncbi:hypothetical protein A2W24_04850 [Microgenomates group bacterium RBG_16_45_19]|nr:MAG: hypothetical protein A2W24_04850 [Microgenomates group bacterium RBG_16_45_19]